MICILALVVFGILGIFSASHRKIAAKAFDCVFRRVTLRPCQSGLDRQLKTGIISFFSKKNVSVARFVVKYFEVISWIFTLLLILSIFFSVQGVYFYVVYGNCNGENSDQFCVFDALHGGEEASVCGEAGEPQEKNYTTPSIDDDPYIGSKEAKVTIIEFGCYSCPYTKKARQVVNDILKEYKGEILYVYRDFHIPAHPGSEIRASAAGCAYEKGKFWEYHNLLFEKNDAELDEMDLVQMAVSVGIEKKVFEECMESGEYLNEAEKDFEDGLSAGVYGTPTFFINDRVVVGPKPFRYFKTIIDEEIKRSIEG